MSLNPHVPEFIPDRLLPLPPYPFNINRISTNMMNNQMKKILWSPVKEWIPFYRCQSCREVMSKKKVTKIPQNIHNCSHIVCAECIIKTYVVKLSDICPVEGCNKCINPNKVGTMCVSNRLS